MIDVVFAAVIYTAGGFIAVDPTPMRALACEERKAEVMQSRDAVCVDFEGLLSMQENGFTMFRFEPSLEGEL
jgi:hypothetical protein